MSDDENIDERLLDFLVSAEEGLAEMGGGIAIRIVIECNDEIEEEIDLDTPEPAKEIVAVCVRLSEFTAALEYCRLPDETGTSTVTRIEMPRRIWDFLLENPMPWDKDNVFGDFPP